MATNKEKVQKILKLNLEKLIKNNQEELLKKDPASFKVLSSTGHADSQPEGSAEG